MPRKKPLVENARPGLDALKSQLFQSLHEPPASYRERFRQLAHEKVRSQNRDSDSKSPPNR